MKAYIYNDKIYCKEDVSEREEELGHEYGGDLRNLLWDIEENDPEIYHESTTTVYYIGDEYFGTDDDCATVDLVEEILDEGFEEIEEIEA